MSLNVLSLFAGIGGLELGLERAGLTVVGQVEIDEYCRRVLAKHWPEVPRHDDVRTAVEWWQSELRPWVDVICGGFPCQDISNAGRRAGITGARSGLWSFMADAVRVLRPRYVVMENVSAILVRGLDVVTADLHEIGYDLQWDCIPASAFGAHHQRDRWWAVAYPCSQAERRLTPGWRVEQPQGSATSRPTSNTAGDGSAHEPESDRRVPLGTFPGAAGGAGVGHPAARTEHLGRSSTVMASTLADAACSRRSIFQGSQAGTQRTGRGAVGSSSWWDAEPRMGRVVNGIRNRMDRPRLQALGNAVVPQVAEHVGRLLVDFEAAA